MAFLFSRMTSLKDVARASTKRSASPCTTCAAAVRASTKRFRRSSMLVLRSSSMRASSPSGPAKSWMRFLRLAVHASREARIPRTSPSVRSPKARKAFRAAFSAATALAVAGSMVPSNGKSSRSSRMLASLVSPVSGSSSDLGGSGGGSKGSKIWLHSVTLKSRSFLTRSVAASTSRWQSSESTSRARWKSSSAASCRSFREAMNSFCRSRRFSRHAFASLPTFTSGMPPPCRSPTSRAAAPDTGAGTPAAPW
mmetsp:Transcript_132107/g.313127  ORF Transcript_132107/g.313127 Transcript_132107/m.313127 type:complete len:253 (-) Transcript_132107:335-1093(-)